jgi:hypothetical protein
MGGVYMESKEKKKKKEKNEYTSEELKELGIFVHKKKNEEETET